MFILSIFPLFLHRIIFLSILFSIPLNLEIENTSYNSLLSGVRLELAINYLLATTMSADKIALELGFEETGSLRTAFKRWTGSTMKEYRKQHA